MSLWLQVIAADGEMKASRSLKEAADIIGQSPSALQLRYLQTLTQIATEKNSTIIFPLPIEMLKGFKIQWLTVPSYVLINVVLNSVKRFFSRLSNTSSIYTT